MTKLELIHTNLKCNCNSYIQQAKKYFNKFFLNNIKLTFQNIPILLNYKNNFIKMLICLINQITFLLYGTVKALEAKKI